MDLESEKVVKLKVLLRRFTKAELLQKIPRLYDISLQRGPGEKIGSKDSLVEQIAELLQEESEDLENVIRLIQLKHVQIKSKLKNWSALKLVNASALLTKSSSSPAFAQNLEKHLNRKQFFCKVSCLFTADHTAMWTVVTFKKLNSDHYMYLLNYTDIPVVLFCNLLPAHKQLVHEALRKLFKATDVKPILIKTHNVSSLLHLCLRESKDFDPTLFPEIVQSNLKKRKAEEDEPELPRNTVNEDSAELLKRKSYMEKEFGAYEEPPLEILTYNAETEAYGIPLDTPPCDTFICKIVFKGKNVMEGFHQLVEAGYMKYPMPDFIQTVPYSGTNTFKLKRKRKRTDGSSTSSL